MNTFGDAETFGLDGQHEWPVQMSPNLTVAGIMVVELDF